MGAEVQNKKTKSIRLADTTLWLSVIVLLMFISLINGIYTAGIGRSSRVAHALFSLIIVVFGMHHFYNIVARVRGRKERAYPVWVNFIPSKESREEIKETIEKEMY